MPPRIAGRRLLQNGSAMASTQGWAMPLPLNACTAVFLTRGVGLTGRRPTLLMRPGGRVAQRESTPFTRVGSEVQSLSRPPATLQVSRKGARHAGDSPRPQEAIDALADALLADRPCRRSGLSASAGLSLPALSDNAISDRTLSDDAIPEQPAARQQSGLSKAEVQTLLRSEGYSRLGAIEADPNSVWVWQADAMKDGRRVRVGIDYRGNVLVISPEANRPCTAPGVNYGVGGLGVGAELSAASACPNP